MEAVLNQISEARVTEVLRAYHWSPEVGRAMELPEFAEWVRRAEAVLKARGVL